MKQLSILLCLTTRDNEFQRQQALDAERAAEAEGVHLSIIDAENDSIEQSQRLLHVIQAKGLRPDAIVFEPVSSTGLPNVARAAVAAGIAWGVLNREVDYLDDLRRLPNAIVFGFSSDHTEIGRIQAAQLKALVPDGGDVLLIEGPAENAAAKQRTQGFLEKKALTVNVKHLRGKWSNDSGFRSIDAWLRLSTSRQTKLRAVVAQNDDMAMGARRAFETVADAADRPKWLSVPFLGVDGLPAGGQQWVQRGSLTATVMVPPNSGAAIKAVVAALRMGVRPQRFTLTAPVSFPELGRLSPVAPPLASAFAKQQF